MASSSAVEDEHLTDSDLSDEEAQGQEQRQEELRSITPRPAYSDEELNQLMENVQHMTLLYTLDHRSWQEKTLDMIRRWLLEVHEPLLTIFYEGNTLSACLGAPEVPVVDMTYFLREPNAIFTVDGFHDEVHCGTVHSDVDGCLMHVLDLIYAPVFRNHAAWGENVKQRFGKGLDKFLAFLTGMHYKMSGMAVLYVPHVLIQNDREGVASDRQFLQSLEWIVVYWATQIRTLLNDRTLTVPHDFVTVSDEFEFWQYRYEVLKGLNAQLAQKDVQQIIKLLRKSHSVYSSQLDELIEQADIEMKEAISNIKYLHLLIKPCAEIDEATSPAAVTKCIPRIVHLIRYIWLNSEHYKCRDLITGLFRNLSNQIIRGCMKQVDIGKILSGSPRFGMKMCNMSIDCCETYKGIYKHMSKEHALREPQVGWALDDAIIFNHVDAFVERLTDVVDICESMIVFGRLDENESIAEPQFGGTNGHELEKIAANVERQFMEMLTKLRVSSKDTILNVHRNEWYEQVAEYRRTVQGFQETLQRLISNVFQNVCNVEEEIEALNVTLFYSYRGSLRKIYLRQVSKVWLRFSEEMDVTSLMLRERSKLHESWLPYYVSRALGFKTNLERLTWMRNRLTSSEWLPPVPEAAKVLSKFETLRKEFELEMRKSFKEWQNNCCATSSLNHKLDRYLLTRSKLRRGLLECNIDPSVLDICEEAQHFEQLGFVLPVAVKKLYEQHDNLRLIYSTALEVCLGYNRIMAALSEQERKLFRGLLHACDRKIMPGLCRLTYGDELSESYIEDCALHTSHLQEIVKLHKRTNRHVARYCEKICDTPMLKLKCTGAVAKSVFEEHLADYIKRASSVLRSCYNNIIELIFAVSKEFEPYMAEMSVEWHSYVNSFDDMLSNAFLISARRSLANISAALQRDEKMAAAPILVMESDIKDRRIVFTPDMDAIAALLSGTADRIHNILDQFSRIGQKMKLPKQKLRESFAKMFRKDEECAELLRSINAEIAKEREDIAGYIDTWNAHRAVWETTELEFKKRLRATPMTAGVFEGSIEFYSELADDISFVEAITHIHFVLINQNAIKSSILDWIEKWQALNISMLLEHSSSLIRRIYRYMRQNERKIMTVPRTLKETLAAKLLFERLVEEVPKKQSTFAPMLELFVLLDKYKVKLSDETRDQVSALETAWLDYLKIMIEADEMLDNEGEDFNVRILQHSEKCKIIFKEFQDDIYMKMPTKNEK
ncbi:dynein heavy chain 2, axonemal [Scaptodrosophila lebanonensis]|uniref:Dynein heavy chain 2, axonemal n=1 Tax=Drosophila lebanonensis TaxID=7225 RepID=A0A6J2U824_DROLE|nr:dynein heavy chain 2, axonemal [Scaptodrosophila lebanonensis]